MQVLIWVFFFIWLGTCICRYSNLVNFGIKKITKYLVCYSHRLLSDINQRNLQSIHSLIDHQIYVYIIKYVFTVLTYVHATKDLIDFLLLLIKGLLEMSDWVKLQNFYVSLHWIKGLTALTLVDRTLTLFRPLSSVVCFNSNGKKFYIHCSK
jgi:hypothetical protein